MKNFIKVFVFCMVVVLFFAGIKSGAAQSVTYVRASHILVDTQQQAKDIKTRIDKGESFEKMANQYSKCPSGQNGGDLGWFGRGQMVPEFENVAFNLPVGRVSDPFKTQFGWHIIKVYAKK